MPRKRRKDIICPFCGEQARPDREHLWAQWMRDQPLARSLLADAHGRQISWPSGELAWGENGRLEAVRARTTRVAELLPHMTIDVCKECNSGWMSTLERTAGEILKPHLGGSFASRLEAPQLVELTTWATKTWMAYVTPRSSQRNPFQKSDYRFLRDELRPLPKSRVWIGYTAKAPNIACSVDSLLIESTAWKGDLAKDSDNLAFCYLGCGHVLMYGIYGGATVGPEVLDLWTPPEFKGRRIGRCWPNPSTQFFPARSFAADEVKGLVDYGRFVINQIGLPALGLTRDEHERVRSDYMAGRSAWELHQRWKETGVN